MERLTLQRTAMPAHEPTDARDVIADRYEVVRPLGRGAFGRTLLARDRVDRALRALKLLDPTGTADWKARELFEREAAVLQGLRHHGIPQVFDTQDVAWHGVRTPMLVLEYVEGPSLAEIIDARRPLDPADVLRLLFELLGILEYLHGRVPPVLHRDIKPANVIVRPDGTPTLVDFGSVRVRHLGADDAGSTIAGTYGYMPYEQYMGQASPTSDLFALGATFLHLLTGRPPRDFMDEGGHIAVPADLPGDPRIAAVLARMLRAAPADRFPSARDARAALLSPAMPSTPSSAAPSLPMAPGAAGTAVRRATSLPADALTLLATPAPRALDARLTALRDRLVPRIWQYLETQQKVGRPGVMAWFGIVGLGLATAGVLPAVFVAVTRARRRRVTAFLVHGSLATARIHRIEPETLAFGEKMARVHYEYEADGVLHRDSEPVLPIEAGRWMIGDPVHVLYVAGDPYDSVILGR